MKESVKGTIALFFSYIAWGLHPLYWKLLQHVSSMEILMHRVLWSVVFGVALVTMQRHWGAFRTFLRCDKKGLAWLAAGGFSVALNWFLFIWAVNHGRILETSLAYFINPLVSMLFGYLFFSERMRPLQKGAIALAFSGVAMQCWIVGSIPFVSLGIALSFAIYGAIKKKVSVDPGVGLLIETAFVAPIALLYLIYAQRSGVAAYPYTAGTNLLLAGGGVIAAIPLVLFRSARSGFRFRPSALCNSCPPASHSRSAPLYTRNRSTERASSPSRLSGSHCLSTSWMRYETGAPVSNNVK